jgi:O-antigen/teichoic acid export membrane protein
MRTAEAFFLMMSALLSRFRSDGIDASPTGLYAVGTRLVSAAVLASGGLLALLLLDPERIGIFLSVTALSAFTAVIDLGLSYSLLLAASSRRPEEAEALAWIAMLAAMLIVPATGAILFLGGAVLLDAGDVDSAAWFWPWLVFCVLSSIQAVLVMALTYVEGTGRRHEAWRANFWIEVAAGIVFVGLIVARHELWALAAGAAVRIALIAALFLFVFKFPHGAKPRSWFGLWRAELWPMQWKNLVNTISGLLTTRLITPLLLAVQGAVMAGRMGLVLSLAFLIVAVASVWPLSQSGLFTSLFHEGREDDLKRVFGRTFLIATGLALAGFAGVGVLLTLLVEFSPYMAARLPGPAVTWLLLAAAPLSNAAGCLAIVIRSQRRDPGVIPNLILTVLTLAVLWLAAQRGALTFSLTYLCMAAAAMLLYAWLFRQFIRRMQRNHPK